MSGEGRIVQKLYDWQQDCLRTWMGKGGRGIVSAVTGSGKTLLALGAVEALEQSLKQRGESLRVRIVVPKTFLIAQWRRPLLEELEIPRAQIGCYCGSHKDDTALPYLIYVMNSARFSLSRHILADLEQGFHVLLIVDECHHCAGEINAKIFDFVPRLRENRRRYHALALSATAEKITSSPRFSAALGEVICRYDLPQALEQGVVSDYRLFHVEIDFLPEEQEEYEAMSLQMAKSVQTVKRLCPSLRRLSGAAFFARLEGISCDGGPAGKAAASVLRLSYRRRELAHLAKNREDCACRLSALLPAHSRVLLFGERIESAERIYRRLAETLPGQVALYHSGMGRESAKNALLRYQNGETRILVSCRALDEGLNVPETDVGIVVSASRTELQRVQRLGRILRRGDTDAPARLYTLQLTSAGEGADDETRDAVWLRYDGDEERFHCPALGGLPGDVLARAKLRGASPEVLAELQKNLELSIVRGDFALSEEACLRSRDAADSRALRNYHTACLLLARERNL